MITNVLTALVEVVGETFFVGKSATDDIQFASIRVTYQPKPNVNQHGTREFKLVHCCERHRVIKCTFSTRFGATKKNVQEFGYNLKAD